MFIVMKLSYLYSLLADNKNICDSSLWLVLYLFWFVVTNSFANTCLCLRLILHF